jgi:hypothetical protein
MFFVSPQNQLGAVPGVIILLLFGF